MFVCSLCKCDFKNVTSLYIHVKNHQIAGNLKIPYYCEQKLKNSGQLCVKNYSSLKSWAAHLRSHHSYLEENDCSDGPTLKYACFHMFVSDDQPTNEMDSNVQEHMMVNEDFQCKSSTVSSDMCDMSYVHHIAARSIANLRADSSVTGVASVKAADCCNEVTEPLIQFLQDKVSQFMAKNAPKVDRSCLMELFESAKRPLEFLDSDRKQRKYFKENMGFVEPETVYYGASHRETAYNEGKTRSIQKYDSWQYIPLLDTLRSLFSNTKLIEKLNEPSNANSRVLLDFRHGKQLAENPFFSDKSRKTVAIELYYDDLEPANPLGSKATIHKIAVFYFTIKNLPFHLTCSMANIHLAYTDDVAKKYGFDSVLNHFMRDFKIFESDGFLVKIDGKEERIFGSLSLVSGDNLAIHTMLGFVGGFNANYFCHTCLALKKDIQSQFDEQQFEFRTVANYESQLQAMSNGDVTTTETGLRQRCILNQLSHWHVTENKTGDLMHDFLEGVGPFEVKLLLSSIVNDKHLSLHEINDRIDNFPYGPTDAKQRPSSIPNMHCDDHSLKQRAMQFWALFRLMPLIIGDAIPSENPYWQFYLDLRAIADLLFAPKWTLGNLNYYRTLYGEHLEKFKLLFPDYNLIPKHHFLIHYATFAEHTGPPYKTMVVDISNDLSSVDPELVKMMQEKLGDQYDSLNKKERDSLRRRLVRVVIKHYALKSPNLEILPKRLALIAYSLTVHFPNLKDTDSLLGYEWLYSPNSKRGYLRQCYYNMRHKEPIKKRAYKRRLGFAGVPVNSTAKLTDEEVEQRMLTLKEMIPTSTQVKEQIAVLMEETRIARYEWIRNKSPTITEIVNAWPRLTDCLKELQLDGQFAMSREFTVEEGIDFAERFKQAAIHIAHMAFECRSAVQRKVFRAFDVTSEKDLERMSQDELCVLALLNIAHLVSSRGAIVCRKSDGKTDNVSPTAATQHLIRFIANDSKSVETHVKDMKRADEELKQPFIVAVTPDDRAESITGDGDVMCYLVVDYRAIRVTGPISRALSLLYHCYFCFNVHYSTRLNTVFGFLQKLFGLRVKRGYSKQNEVPPSAANLYMQLKPKLNDK